MQSKDESIKNRGNEVIKDMWLRHRFHDYECHL